VEAEHTFTDATFNDDGHLLYAWAFGRPDDYLHVWRFDEATGDLVFPADSEGSYELVSLSTLSSLDTDLPTEATRKIGHDVDPL
jgi:hypothetical protein